ncbi:hypothetical protein QTV49_004307 [Vibrio vulnificus]|nr:hypothetical protein [Vibrio vulnificus]
MIDKLPQKVKDRIFKLLELSKQGVGGEKDNAEKRLIALLTKYSLTMDDLVDTESRTEITIFYKTKFEFRLVNQILYQMGLDKDGYELIGERNKIYVECTKSEETEFRLKYSIYKQALKKEMELTYQAFIQAQGIFPESTCSEKKEYSSEELANHEKIAMRMSSVDKVSVHQAIEEK